MNIRDKINADGVGVKWFRTFVMSMAAIITSTGVIAGAGWWFVQPRADAHITTIAESIYEQDRNRVTEINRSVSALSAVVDQQANLITQQTETINSISSVVDNIAQEIDEIDRRRQASLTPPWRFDRNGTEVSDVSIGKPLTINVRGEKTRNCGVPIVDIFIKDSNGTSYRLVDLSITDSSGRGILLPSRPGELQEISYTAMLPVTPTQPAVGRAQAWIALSYVDTCPASFVAPFGPLQFRIYEAE